MKNNKINITYWGEVNTDSKNATGEKVAPQKSIDTTTKTNRELFEMLATNMSNSSFSSNNSEQFSIDAIDKMARDKIYSLFSNEEAAALRKDYEKDRNGKSKKDYWAFYNDKRVANKLKELQSEYNASVYGGDYIRTEGKKDVDSNKETTKYPIAAEDMFDYLVTEDGKLGAQTLKLLMDVDVQDDDMFNPDLDFNKQEWEGNVIDNSSLLDKANGKHKEGVKIVLKEGVSLPEEYATDENNLYIFRDEEGNEWLPRFGHAYKYNTYSRKYKDLNRGGVVFWNPVTGEIQQNNGQFTQVYNEKGQKATKPLRIKTGKKKIIVRNDNDKYQWIRDASVFNKDQGQEVTELANGGELKKRSNKKNSNTKDVKPKLSWEQSLFDIKPETWNEFLSKGSVSINGVDVELLDDANNDFSFVDGNTDLASDYSMQMDLVSRNKKPKVSFDKLKKIINGKITTDDINSLIDGIKTNYSADSQVSPLNDAVPDDNPHTLIEAKEDLEQYVKNEKEEKERAEKAEKEMQEQKLQYDEMVKRNQSLRRKYALSKFDKSIVNSLNDKEKDALADYSSYMSNYKGSDYVNAINTIGVSDNEFIKNLVNGKLRDEYVDFKVKRAFGGHILRKPNTGITNNDVKTKLGFYDLISKF